MMGKRILKSIICFALAFEMVFGSLNFGEFDLFPPVEAEAADESYSLRFYNDKTKDPPSQTMTIVEGEPITIQSNLPATYRFADPPFSIVKGDSTSTDIIPPQDIENYFEITPGSNRNHHTLVPVLNSAAGGEQQAYTLQAIYYAIVDEGFAEVNWDGDDNYINQTCTVESMNDLSILSDSWVEFKVRKHNAGSAPSFSKVEDAGATGGDFINRFDGQSVSIGTGADYSFKGGKMTIPITIQSKSSDSQPLDIVLTISGLADDFLFADGTTFRIVFRLPYINPLSVTVVTRQKAVEQAVQDVANKGTTPNATYDGQAYIQLNEGEDLDGIKTNFSVIKKTVFHNIEVELEWEWIAAAPYDSGYVEIQSPTGNSKKTSVTILQRDKADFTGQLRVTAHYKLDLKGGGQEDIPSTPRSITAIIFGTGVPPEFLPQKAITGNQNGPDKEDNLTEWAQTIPMDVYKGSPKYGAHAANSDIPANPYSLKGSISFGDGNGFADYAVITQQARDGLFEVLLDNQPQPYRLGDKIPYNNGNVSVDIRAIQRGVTTFKIQFFNADGEEMRDETRSFTLDIYDSTPSDFALLEELVVTGAEFETDEAETTFYEVYDHGELPFDRDYSSTENNYNILVPNSVKAITVTPTIFSGRGTWDQVEISCESLDDSADDNDSDDTTVSGDKKQLVTSSNPSGKISVEEVGKEYSIYVIVTAQNGDTNRYTLYVRRLPKSGDSSLMSFEAFDTRDDETDLIEAVGPFSPSRNSYTVEVPYSTQEVLVRAVPKDPWVQMWTDPEDQKVYAVEWSVNPVVTQTVSLFQRLLDLNVFAQSEVEKKFLLDRPTKDQVTGEWEGSQTTVITAKVTAENGASSTYTLNVVCLPPSNNANLQQLDVSVNGQAIPFEFGNTFSPNLQHYVVRVPYSTNILSVTTLAEDDENSLGIELTKGADKVEGIPNTYDPPTPTRFEVNIQPVDAGGAKDDPNLKPFDLVITVTAESGDTKEYILEVQRDDPSSDSSLKSLTLADQNGAAIPTFSFNPNQTTWNIEVDYLVTNIVVTPVANFPMSKIKVNDVDITPYRPSYMTGLLEVGSNNVIKVVVTAENGSTRTYTINVTRNRPDNEARLSALKVGSLTFTPKFNPSHYRYKLVIPAGTDGLTVTPTAASPYATITVNGLAVQSGATTNKISPLDAYTDILIVVTAQDGVTKCTYTINVTDENLITKSSNADLASLEFITGELNPPFRAAIYDYEVYVKEDSYAVQIIPETANRHATMKVFADGREIGDHDDEYAISLFEGENEVSIEVVSQDESVTNEYVINIYRGDEEKQGMYDPVTAEEVDFEMPDPIVIDVRKYPVIAADVFNTLKEEYPDKTLMLVGNDYTFTMKGADMDTIVPNTNLYDFSLSFSPPDENDIWDAITDLNHSNEGLDPVYVHFNHTGALPATMKFTISLGHAYRNSELFWNYYNEPRDRIDYYGFVITNGKGTFSLPISHMSTYIVTDERILDAEDKVGGMSGYYTSADPESLTGYYSDQKPNPNTGAGEK